MMLLSRKQTLLGKMLDARCRLCRPSGAEEADIRCPLRKIYLTLRIEPQPGIGSSSVTDVAKVSALPGMRPRVVHEGLQLGRLLPPARVVEVETWKRR